MARPFTRRTLAGAGTAALAAVAKLGTAPPTGPDAELIAMGRDAPGLIAEYETHMATFFALPDGHPDVQRVADLSSPASDKLDAMIERAAELDATTLAGCQAKAWLLRHEMLTSHRGADRQFAADSMETELAWSLVNDLLAGRA